MSPLIKTLLLITLFLFTGVSAEKSLAQEEATRAITQISGNLYRFQNNNTVAVFLVTSEGIILVDPINAEAAEWLKGELAARFDLPVRYVIYSHDHADHTSGGAVFADTATFVGHANSAAKIASSAHTPVPELTFEETMTINLGGSTAELVWPGNSHSDNLIVVRFPLERALFVVDIVAVKRLPYRNMRDYYLPDTVDSLLAIEALDFDTLIPGHGPVGVKADLGDHRRYVAEMLAAVMKARANKMSLIEAQASIMMEDYAGWGQYEGWRTLNIEGMYRILDENQ